MQTSVALKSLNDADNPLKIVGQKATWEGNGFSVSEETDLDVTTVNASGGGNGLYRNRRLSIWG